MILKKSEDAVSPVIGVMLLLVVTIVIAAVVAVFASGVGTDAEPAPATVLDIVDICDTGHSTFEMLVPDFDKIVTDPSITIDEYGCYMKDGEYLFEIANYGYGPTQVTEKPTTVGKNYMILLDGGMKPLTVTIKSISGDTLDLSKVSIKVYNSEGEIVADKHQNSLSGTISPGDSKILILDEIINEELIDEDTWIDEGFNVVKEGQKVEVFVLYGEHVIVSKELKVSGGDA